MKLRIITLFFLLITANIVFSQYSPVQWSYDSEKVSNNEFNIIFTAEIENGWYVYSQFLEEGGPIPTSFTFTETKDIEMIGNIEEAGDNKKEDFDELFSMQLIKYGDKVRFTQKIKINTSIKNIKGYLTFMTCNNESCLPPKDIDFEIDLN